MRRGEGGKPFRRRQSKARNATTKNHLRAEEERGRTSDRASGERVAESSWMLVALESEILQEARVSRTELPTNNEAQRSQRSARTRASGREAPEPVHATNLGSAGEGERLRTRGAPGPTRNRGPGQGRQLMHIVARAANVAPYEGQNLAKASDALFSRAHPPRRRSRYASVVECRVDRLGVRDVLRRDAGGPAVNR